MHKATCTALFKVHTDHKNMKQWVPDADRQRSKRL